MREFARRLDDLVAALFLEDTFPHGVILSTGTALVPDSPFTLESGDDVEIEIDILGSLRNPVVRGKANRSAKKIHRPPPPKLVPHPKKPLLHTPPPLVPPPENGGSTPQESPANCRCGSSMTSA